MAKNRINIEVATVGAEETKAKLDQTAQAAGQVGDKANEAGKKGQEGLKGLEEITGHMDRNFSSLLDNATSLVARLTGVAASIKLITDAIGDNTRAIEENAKIAMEQQESLSRLQYLGAFFSEKPELRQEVAAMAEYGRRDFNEVAGAWYNLRSKSGSLSDETQRGILTQALEMGRTDTEAPLDTLIDMFSLYAKKTGETDANRIQNVLLQTVNEAGGSIGDVANYMPQFLPVGMAGGLTGPEASGLWSYATTQTGSASVATTALRAVFMGLEGRGTPESQKLFKKLGITSEQSFMDKIGRLKGIDLGQAELIAGREGASMMIDLINKPAAMNDTIQSVVGVDRPGVDLTRDMLDQLMGSDRAEMLRDEITLLGVRNQNLQGSDVAAMQAERNRLLHESQILAGDGRASFGERTRYNMTNWVNWATMGVAGYDVREALGAGGMTINNGDTIIYARPGGDPTPRISPADVGAEEPR